MSFNVAEVIETLELPKNCLNHSSEEGIPIYCKELKLVSHNSIQFVSVDTREEIESGEVLFEPIETHREFEQQMTDI